MEQAVMDIPVTLVIKAPNQKYDDQTINCFLDWTVEKLKTHLSKVYPSKPLTKDQRLVYSGKLLLDHLRLKDILRKQDECHMVHLVCASRSTPNSPKPSTSRGSTATENTSSRSSSEHSGSSLPVSTTQDMPSTSSNPRTEENLRHRHNPHTYSDAMHSHSFPYNRQPSVGNLPAQAVPAGFPVYSVFTPLQMMWWQQIYARQYYMQYQAAASSQGTFGNAVAQPPATPTINSDRPPPNPPRAAPNIAPEVNQNVQMNAQGGPVMNEEDINRDWLDWMYTVSRAAILLSIVYFYSSFSRFVMVMGAMILVYMHQAGWFPFRQEDGQLQAREDLGDVNNDQVNNNDLLEMERRMDEGIQDDGAEERGDDVPAVAPLGLVASAWSFITTFFTSLIPEGPPQVVN
ncbi:homocysteine-responsive endoplasmic reticulum-resident ubiquitin-like domain member 2 protein isoform X1 [Hyla sarda]|uniref:homocysteine-responsive endoplasmic reticulum-resident ubiquitin-like domain member 2 protein isoform X1 n=1 Tax=Hyla sarda TaxID=327740 RepID=UPI0024C46E0E|nr:homocysteine-responsive endoplasmic reticulum-resident ubiquitin-like domain member 2 protein isoform X1 [Hyla sarda]XP_056376465.1 homocysteine-responsive endoplasmic reticulum-resident ubiquitin-like domain member 2 protein isoform X1 [Hyla sarda]